MNPHSDRLQPMVFISSLPGLFLLMGALQVGIALAVYCLGSDRTISFEIWILALVGSTVLTLLLALPRLRSDRQILETLISSRTQELMDANAQLIQEIQERKHIEVALRQRETTLKKVQQIAHIGSWEADLQTLQITWSEELYRIHGLDPTQPIPTHEEIQALTHPDDRWIHQQEIIAPLRAGQSFATDLRIVRPNGEIRYVEARGEPVFNEHNQIVGYLGMSRDLTDRKLTEEKLRKSEALLREAQEAASMGCWEYDLIAQKTIWTEGIYRIHGRDPNMQPPTYQELLDQVIYPDDLPIYKQQLLQRYKSGQPFECDFRITQTDGSIRWIASKGEPVFNQQGQVIRYVGIVLDITDRKLAEEKLRQSEATNRALLQAIPDLLIRIHRDGTYLDVYYGGNVRVFNLDKAQIDKHIEDVLPCEKATKLMQAIQEVLRTQNIGIEEQQVVFKQNIYYEEIRLVPCADDEVLMIIRDVSDRKCAELELQSAKEAAEAANRSKSVFLSSISHELRTPLNAILGFTQLLDRDLSLTHEQRRYIQTINRNSQHLLELINDVLEVSKIEAGQVALHEDNFDLYQLLDNLEEVFRLKATAKNLTLTVERAPALPQYIYTDSGKLRQILTNLLSNAIKFTLQGQVILRVKDRLLEVRPTESPSGSLTCVLYFEVQDTGLGIAVEEFAQLFKPFSQTASGRQASEGTGLGLVISHRFVELMGGEMGVISTSGQGSTFWFTVPVQSVNSDCLSISLPTRKVMGLEPNQPTYRILIVEDQAENAEFLRQLLSIVGFDIQQAANGQKGIQVWEVWKPHLILMDMRMPVMDGYAASRAIKATAQGQETVIIATTGSAFEEDRDRILAIGCDDFIRKPCQENLLFAKIAYHLGVRYQYDETEDRDRVPNSRRKSFSLSATDLCVLPSNWIVQLNEAARECNEPAVFELLNQMSTEYEDLAIALKQLATDFRFEEIATLTAQTDL